MKTNLSLLFKAGCIVVMFTVPFLARDQSHETDQGKANDIRKLMEVSGSLKLGDQIMDAMFSQFKMRYPDVPTHVWDATRAEAKGNITSLTNMLISIYDKYFNHEEIRELIEFYETPIGKKLLRVQPQIMQEAMLAGQQWGLQIGKKVEARLKSDGFIKN